MATFTVTSLSDVTDANDGVLTLREAAELANTTAGADTIDFDTGIGGAIEGGGLIRLVQGEIELSDDISIVGENVVTITGDAGGNDVIVAGSDISDAAATSEAHRLDNTRIFSITDESAASTLSGLTLTGGRTSAAEGGGAVHALGALTIESSTLTGNWSDGTGDGGAIAAKAGLTVIGSMISDNRSNRDGGGIYLAGDGSIATSTISGNYATFSGGGIEAIGGSLAIESSTISNNSAARYATFVSFAQGEGAGIRGDMVTVTDSVVSGNIGTNSGGGIRASTAVLVSSEVTGNTVNEGYFSVSGGGVFASVITASNSTIAYNSLFSSFNGASSGGGLASGTANLVNTTVHGNQNTGGQAIGGGISSANLTLTSSTVTANSAIGLRVDGGFGGGVAGFNEFADVSIVNSLIHGNLDEDGTSDVSVSPGASYDGTNIVGDAILASGGTPVGMTSASQIFASTVIRNGVQVGSLGQNGGAVQTVALLTSGDAVDAGDSSLLPTDLLDLDGDGDTAEVLSVDARGFARFVGSSVDIGAFEFQVLPIEGTSANDVLNGTAADDSILGLSGNDTLNGRAGADTLDGGPGDDRFFVDDIGDVVIEAPDEGRDTVTTSVDFTLPDNVEVASSSGSGDIQITGNGLANTISGNSGFNEILGLDGADRLRGGDGNDTLSGGPGDDILEGQGDADLFVLGADNGDDQVRDWEVGLDRLDFGALGLRFVDLAITSSGNEALITFDDPAGGTGSVRLVGVDPTTLDTSIMADPGGLGSSGGINLVTGTTGSENFAGTAAGEDLVGLAGNDTLNGRAGDDTMVGGFGNDRYLLDDAGDLAIEQAGQGYDQVDTRFSMVLPDHVEAGAVRGGGAVDLTGNGLDNFITGSDLTNVLLGGDGRDRLIARGGDDTLDGGLDRDVLEGGTGSDLFVFGADSSLDVITDFEIGLDLIDVTALGLAFADMRIVDTPLGALVLFDPDTGGSNGVTLNSVAAADLRLASFVTVFGENQPPITGTEGNDVLRGTVEDDELQGLGGADRIDGLAGADTLIGGPGDDTYTVDNAGDVVVEQPGEGTDLVRAGVDVVLPSDVENASAAFGSGAGGADDPINLTGNALANTLNGNDAANTLTGLDGDDNLQGRAGTDEITGGPGADLLRGGADADTFVFATGDATGTGDRILDFEVGVDTIDLSATGLAFGDLTITGTTNATITYGAETITVFGVSAAEMTEDQFDFGA